MTVRNKMSFMREYNDFSQNLEGFTLNYYKFFQQFTVSRTYSLSNSYESDGSISLVWNGVLLGSMPLVNQPTGRTVCNHMIVNPEDDCRICNVSPFTNQTVERPTYIKHLEDFMYDQMGWIQGSDAQQQYRWNPRRLLQECQRRMNFFLLKLQEGFSTPGVFVNGIQITNQYNHKVAKTLRDIRSLGQICLRI